MSPAMPSSRNRRSASTSRPSRIRSPALSWTTRSEMLSHSGVAYSGWLPTSRYSRAPLRGNTLLLRPQETTRRNRYLATSSGECLRLPQNVHVTPYSFSSPNIRLSIASTVNHALTEALDAMPDACRERNRLRPVHRGVLALGEFQQAVVAALTAEDGVLDVAERGGRVGHDAPVDADHAGVQWLGDAQRGAQVPGVEVGDNPVLGV